MDRAWAKNLRGQLIRRYVQVCSVGEGVFIAAAQEEEATWRLLPLNCHHLSGREGAIIGHISFDIYHLSFKASSRDASDPLKAVIKSYSVRISNSSWVQITDDKCQMIYDR